MGTAPTHPIIFLIYRISALALALAGIAFGAACYAAAWALAEWTVAVSGLLFVLAGFANLWALYSSRRTNRPGKRYKTIQHVAGLAASIPILWLLTTALIDTTHDPLSDLILVLPFTVPSFLIWYAIIGNLDTSPTAQHIGP